MENNQGITDLSHARVPHRPAIATAWAIYMKYKHALHCYSIGDEYIISNKLYASWRKICLRSDKALL